jgi:LuxR family maltose regulon positive regulatory protein
MTAEFLETRVHIPPPPQGLVPRGRVLESLHRGVPDAPLTVISAPAGYGKTTLLAQWARATELPVAWLTASEEDNDPERFLRALLRAWETVQPGIRERPAGILLGAVSPPLDDVLGAIVRELGERPQPLAFAIDDVHVITETAVHRWLDMLLDNLPPGVRFVLAGREAPPLSLARRRARHELLELRAEDVRFTLDETDAFLRDRMGVELAGNDVQVLHEQVEGWAAGLQLAGLTLLHHPDPGGSPRVAGRNRYIADYLGDDVFDRLPEHVQAFLLETSILDRLCDSLCAAVTGNQHSQQMLESLERANLFLIPLDDQRAWFRYHRLFADFLIRTLRRRYELEDILELHARAARWYLAHELPEEAFRHALEAGDRETATQVVGGEFRVAAGWIDALPDAWLASQPELILAEAQALLFQGQSEACARRLADLERVSRATRADRAGSAWATAMRCIIACHANDLVSAERYAQNALRHLPADDHVFRAHIHHALGESYRGHRRWDDARHNYLKSLELLQRRPGNPTARLLIVHCFGALADLELRRGRMQKAAGYWSQAQAGVEDQWGHVLLPISGWVYLRVGELHYEWNDLARARDVAGRGLERSILGGDPQAMIAGHLIMARLELAGRGLPAAESHLYQARHLLERASFPDWLDRLERCQVDLWIAQGRLRQAVAWARDADSESPHPDAPARLAIARVLVHAADAQAYPQARSLLDRAITAAGERGETGVTAEALALRSMLRGQQGDTIGALTDLEQALLAAEPEGYVRLFVDLGTPMARLLREARNRGVMPSYVDRLLAAFGDTGPATGPNLLLAEPLSDREIEVLRLLAVGLSNREIAETLSVSPETIKKHTGNIYGKLGAHGRMEAVATARARALIE